MKTCHPHTGSTRNSALGESDKDRGEFIELCRRGQARTSLYPSSVFTGETAWIQKECSTKCFASLRELKHELALHKKIHFLEENPCCLTKKWI